ncbi:MAG: mycothiol transferase [Streptosporangiaceae bacterium]
MSSASLLVDGFGRIREVVHEVLDGLDDADLDYQPDSEANSICWLIWHLTRVQDDHVAGVSRLEQVWFSGWEEQFDLPLDPDDIGYGHDADQVAAVHATRELLAGYHDETCAQTIAFVSGLTDADLARVVDEHWDPPVTMAVRLMSVLSDDLQHAGQAAYLKGLIERG